MKWRLCIHNNICIHSLNHQFKLCFIISLWTKKENCQMQYFYRALFFIHCDNSILMWMQCSISLHILAVGWLCCVGQTNINDILKITVNLSTDYLFTAKENATFIFSSFELNVFVVRKVEIFVIFFFFSSYCV